MRKIFCSSSIDVVVIKGKCDECLWNIANSRNGSKVRRVILPYFAVAHEQEILFLDHRYF